MGIVEDMAKLLFFVYIDLLLSKDKQLPYSRQWWPTGIRIHEVVSNIECQGRIS